MNSFPERTLAAHVLRIHTDNIIILFNGNMMTAILDLSSLYFIYKWSKCYCKGIRQVCSYPYSTKTCFTANNRTLQV